MENLIKPRFEIIADFPGNVMGIVGDILSCSTYNSDYEHPVHLFEYPHLFKRLEWWEKRKNSEMPEYLKSLIDGCVYKIHKWHDTFGQVEIESMSGCDLTAFTPEYGYVPATKEEYDTYTSNTPTNE